MATNIVYLTGLFYLHEVPMARKLERLDAKRLYVEEKKTIDEIAKLIPSVSTATLYRWCADEEWDKEREEINLTSFSNLRKTLLLMSKKMDEMLLSGEIDPKVADSIAKLSKVVERLDPQINAYGNIILMLGEFTDFLAEKSPELLKQLERYIIEFGNVMSRKYGKR